MSNQTQTPLNLPTIPDWSKALDWAKWFAINKNGMGFWFAKKPWKASVYWDSAGKEQNASGEFDPSNWEKSLQPYPDPATYYADLKTMLDEDLGKPKIEGIKPDGVWIDEAEHFADSSEIKPPRTFSETVTVYFNSEITGYLVGKNSFTTGLVDLLLARMAKEERFSDDETELSYDDIKIFDVVVGETHQFHFKYMFIVTSIDAINYKKLSCSGFGASQWRKSHDAAWQDLYPYDNCRLEKAGLDKVRTITEIEAVEFRRAMEAVYG